MFGIFYGLFRMFGLAGEVIKDNIHDTENRQKAMKTGRDTYLDRYGNSRDINTGHKTTITTNQNGDRVLLDLENFKEIKNYSEPQREYTKRENIKKAELTGQSTYEYLNGYFELDAFRKDKRETGCDGKRYKDFETGDVYVKRRFDYCGYWYMRISDGHLIRLTDNFKKSNKFNFHDDESVINTDEENKRIKDGYIYSYSFESFDFKYTINFERKYFKTREDFRDYFNERQDRYFRETGQINYYNKCDIEFG